MATTTTMTTMPHQVHTSPCDSRLAAMTHPSTHWRIGAYYPRIFNTY